MNNDDLFELIKEVQAGEKDNLTILLKKFEPLIKKYAFKLNYDDAQSQLSLYFIELILKFPLNGFTGNQLNAKIVTYINKAIVYEFYRLSKLISRDIYYIEYDMDISQYKDQSFSVENYIVLLDALKSLTTLQQKVIIYKYVLGYSDMEIGDNMSISRQSVNRLKNRGLYKLREYMS